MLRSIAVISFREILRDRTFWLAIGLVVGLSALTLVIPVRFRDPVDFASESLRSLQTLYAVLFAGLFCVPLVQRGRFCFESMAIGPLVATGPMITLAHLIGQLLALGVGWVLVDVTQILWLQLHALEASPGGFLLDSITLVWRGATFCALARLVGAVLPRILAYVVMFGLLVSVNYVAALPPGTWTGRVLSLVIPSFDLFETRVSVTGDVAGTAGVIAYALGLILLANLLTGWFLESARGSLAPLDPPRIRT